jgi:hypothetical protein
MKLQQNQLAPNFRVRIPAEFIIRENGTLATAHYSRFLGDHLPLPALQAHLA